MEEKLMLLGKHIIINEGDFKGVTGILKSVELINDSICVNNSKNQIVMNWYNQQDIECKIIVNDRNTIKVSINCISKLA